MGSCAENHFRKAHPLGKDETSAALPPERPAAVRLRETVLCSVRFTFKPRHYYDCSSQFPGHGPACGARSVQQAPADQTVDRIISTHLLDAPYLRMILGKFRSAEPPLDHNAEKLSCQREKLEAERQRLLRLTLKGACSEEDFARESKRIEEEMRGLDLLAPAPLPAAFDASKLVVRITRTFARFGKQPFEEKRDLLRAAVREIVLDDGTINALTLNGAFLDCANSLTRSFSR
jgi:hypothetical protein